VGMPPGTKASPSTPSISYKNHAKHPVKSIPKSTQCSTEATLPALTASCSHHSSNSPSLVTTNGSQGCALPCPQPPLRCRRAWLRTLLSRPSRPNAASPADAIVAQPRALPDRRAQAQGVRQRAGPRQGRPTPARAMLPTAGGAGGPRRRTVPLHRHQGQCPRHPPQRAP
jgi:hypothetical protein